MTETVLRFLTLNTGHISDVPRNAVDQRTIDQLLPIIDAEGGPVPGLDGWFLDFLFPLDERRARKDGAAFFQIARSPGMSKTPATMCMACWAPELAPETWSQLTRTYRIMQEPLQRIGLWREPPSLPPQTPWLAVFLNPILALAPPPVETLMLFGDLEKCVAWALMHDAALS